MKLVRRQKIWLALVLIANVLLWAWPSDVVELIARDSHTLLGRYSRRHLAVNFAVLFASMVSFYIDWAHGAAYKRRWFQVIATMIFLVPGIGLLDFFLRSPQQAHYIKDSLAYHHPPGEAYTAEFADLPEAKRSYPGATQGYPTIKRTLSIDARGFRNAMALERCDVLVLGDSFAEGSGVSDEHAWPVLLGERAGLSVYNLGMSGYDPSNYLACLTEIGLGLSPKHVFCMLYEGNDFRRTAEDSGERQVGFAQKARTYFKQSPLIRAIDQTLIETLGPVGSQATVPGCDILDWLPLSIPEGALAKRYAFAPKQLRDIYRTTDRFAMSAKWLSTRRLIERMNEACTSAGAGFTLVYAPTKAHVLLPIIKAPPEKVRAFAAIELGDDLPDGASFVQELLTRAGGREAVVRAWCEREGIGWLSATEPLRSAMLAGKQAYFTYDQHWTPTGHEIIAAMIALTLPSEEDSVAAATDLEDRNVGEQ